MCKGRKPAWVENAFQSESLIWEGRKRNEVFTARAMAVKSATLCRYRNTKWHPCFLQRPVWGFNNSLLVVNISEHNLKLQAGLLQNGLVLILQCVFHSCPCWEEQASRESIRKCSVMTEQRLTLLCTDESGTKEDCWIYAYFKTLTSSFPLSMSKMRVLWCW